MILETSEKFILNEQKSHRLCKVTGQGLDNCIGLWRKHVITEQKCAVNQENEFPQIAKL